MGRQPKKSIEDGDLEGPRPSQLVSELRGSSHRGSQHVEEMFVVDSLEGRILRRLEERLAQWHSVIESSMQRSMEIIVPSFREISLQVRREEMQRQIEASATRFENPSIVDEATPPDHGDGDSCNEVLCNEPVARQERRREEPQLHRHREVVGRRQSVSVAESVESSAAHQVFGEVLQRDRKLCQEEAMAVKLQGAVLQPLKGDEKAILSNLAASAQSRTTDKARHQPTPPTIAYDAGKLVVEGIMPPSYTPTEAEDFSSIEKHVRKRLVFDPGGAISNRSKPHFLTTSSSALSFLIKPWCLFSIQGKIKKLVRLTLRTRSVLRGWVCQRPKPSSSAAVLFSTAEPSSSINSSSLRLAN